MVSKLILMRFVESIVPLVIGLLLDHPQIYSLMLEIASPYCVRYVGDSRSTRNMTTL